MLKIGRGLHRLLDRTPEAFYWVGFLAADGCVYKNTLSLSQRAADRERLECFRNFVMSPAKISENRAHVCSVVLCDKHFVQEFKRRTGLVERKTYNPPNDIPTDDPDLRFAYAVGFVDGDGCIRAARGSSVSLKIKCHSSWLGMLQKIGNSLIDGVATARLDTCGYACISVFAYPVLRQIKQRVISLSLPALVRKWDVINLDYRTYQERAAERRESITHLADKGMNQRRIARELDMSPGAICVAIRKHKISFVGEQQVAASRRIAIRQLLIDGIPQVDIAVRLGVTPAAVSHAISQYNLRDGPCGLWKEAEVRRAKISRHLRAGMRQSEIAREVGISQSAVCLAIKKYGLRGEVRQ